MSDRYLRHSLIDWFDQDMIKTLNVLVVGAGAVGNEVIKNLCLLGIGSIRIVDFDKIEAHNLTRSVLFTEGDIGQNKAVVAATAASKLDPNCRLSAIEGSFWEKITFDQLQEASVVFCCVDNFTARFQINQLCSLLGVDLINAGIDSRYVSAEIYPFLRDPDCACYECNLPPSIYERVAERFSCGWLRKVAYEEKKIPTTTVTASFAGALATSLFLYSFREDAESGARRVFIDTVSGISSKANLPTNESCVSCGGLPRARTIVKAKRMISKSLPWLNQIPTDLLITLSDPILTQWEFPNCAVCSREKQPVVFQRASAFSDVDAVCGKCGLNQKLAVIKDRFTLRELVDEFQGRPLPGKFLHFNIADEQIIIELQDGDANA